MGKNKCGTILHFTVPLILFRVFSCIYIVVTERGENVNMG